MLNLDKTGIDKLLVQLEDKQFFGNRYRLYKEKAEPVLLGKGTFSYVYEMYDYKNSDKHYAAKAELQSEVLVCKIKFLGADFG